jgi:hypothetical protein
MKNNLLKIAIVAMVVIAISLSGCTEQVDTADTGSLSQQETTADSTSELPLDNDVRPEPEMDSDGQPGDRRDQQEIPDLAAAAAELGVTEEALQTALGEPGQVPPDFTSVASELGVTEEALMEALGASADGLPTDQP